MQDAQELSERIISEPDLTLEIPPEEVSVMEFFSVEGIAKGLKAGTWAVDYEIQVLADIAKNEEEQALTRMAAIKMIREHMKEALVLSGRLQSLSAQQAFPLGGGGIGLLQVQGQRLSPENRLPSPMRTEQLLAEGLRTQKYLTLKDNTPDEGSSDESEGEGTACSSEQAETASDQERDYGGGGLCLASQLEAESARLRVAQAGSAPPSANGDGGGDPDTGEEGRD